MRPNMTMSLVRDNNTVIAAFLVVFSTLVLKLSFSQSLSLHSRLSLPRADVVEL